MPLHTESRAPSSDADLATAVGEKLRRLRGQSELSLEQLARRSGVSRAMLSQIELGRSAPTITVLSKIATALGTAVSVFLAGERPARVEILRRAGAKELRDAESTFVSRALFPFQRARKTEFYELRLQPDSRQSSAAHAPGTTENLVVSSGRLRIEIEGMSYELGEGDALFFNADVPHAYFNPGVGQAVAYLVMNYPETVNS